MTTQLNQAAGWFAGAMTNAPTGSGWLFVHKFGATGNFILQRWHDFTDPSIFGCEKLQWDMVGMVKINTASDFAKNR